MRGQAAERMPANTPYATLSVRVLPRSSKDEIAGRRDDIYKIRLTAPAVEGKANKALIELLAKRLGIAKTHIRIVSGERARIKSIRIDGVSPDQVDARLKPD